MTSFNFLIYLCTFLPAVMLLYHLAPQKWRWMVLLAASYVFIYLQSGTLAVYIVITTLSVYACALWLEKLKTECAAKSSGAEKSERKAISELYSRRENTVLALGLVINFGIIAVLKYSGFFASAVNSAAGTALKVRSFALPVGISFYTMMAASYIIDVKRGTVHADSNPGRVALYLAFFPQILEGPMARYSETAEQLFAGRDIEYKNLTYGLQRIAFGMAKRMIVADRVNNYISYLHMFYETYDGGMIAIGTLCYSFQIYMDFSGTIDIALGTAEIFGITLPENFRRPFFSRTVSEFWARWHVTLGRWFTDYIFYPVSMSAGIKKLTKASRKKLGNFYGPLLTGSLALLAVWVCNGLWHGAGWQYLFFGLYYFVIIFISRLTEPARKSAAEKLGINTESRLCKVLQMLRTALIFNLGELFFSAPDLKAAFTMLRIMLTDFTLKSVADGTVARLWLDGCDAAVLILFAAVLTAAGIRAERGHDLRDGIASLKPAARYAVYAFVIMAALIFGGYGFGYSYVEPIYANF